MRTLARMRGGLLSKLIYGLVGFLAYGGVSTLFTMEASSPTLSTPQKIMQQEGCHCPLCQEPSVGQQKPCPSCPRAVSPKQEPCAKCLCPEPCPKIAEEGEDIVCDNLEVTPASVNGQKLFYSKKRNELAEELVMEGGLGGIRIAIGAVFNNESSEEEKADVKGILAPYIKAGLVELRYLDNHELTRTNIYQHIIYPSLEARDPQIDWVMFVDMDEFAYGTGEYESLAELFAAQKGNNIGEICSGFEFFGSSDYFYQPHCIVPSMTRRGELRPSKGRCAFRPEAQDDISPHGTLLLEGWESIGRNAPESTVHDMHEDELQEYPLRVAQYRMQSFEYHFNVRAERGSSLTDADADSPQKDVQGHGPSLDGGHKLVSDLTLAQRRHWHGWGLACGPDSWESLFGDWKEDRPFDAMGEAFQWLK